MVKLGTPAALLLAIGVCIVNSGLASIQGSQWVKSSVEVTRISRSLLATDFPAYLIPTREAEISSGACNSDYQASPYWLQHLNSSALTIGGQPHTTFYLQLYSDQQQCLNNPGSIDCCAFNITEIWLDVDPMLTVKYASFHGQTTNFAAIQDQYGFHLSPAPGSLLSIPSEGILLTVTVAGSTPELCQTPDYTIGAPVEGICQVIVSGSTAHDTTDTCCPFGLAKPVNPNSNYVPVAPQCAQSISSSPFSLSLQSVTAPFSAGSGMQANYTFLVESLSTCNATAINQCCGMILDSLDISIVSGSSIVGAQLGGQSHMFALAPGENAAFQTMTLQGVNIAPGSGPVSLVVTVKLRTHATTVPDLCRPIASTDGTVGDCDYVMHAASNSLCCPASTTGVVTAGVTPPNPQPGTCAPAELEPLASTTMGFNYYDGPLPSSQSTKFVFMVYNNATCNKPFCQDVCNWQLFINPAFAGMLTFESEDNTQGSQDIQSNGNLASVTFSNAPAHGASLTYTITVAQAGVTLDQLCSSAGVPGQTTPCAAIIRSPAVYSIVQFSQSDRVLGGPPSPTPGPGPAPESCTSGRSLDQSCVRVDSAMYNTPSTGSPSTVMDFMVVNHDGDAGCTPDDSVMTFQVLLQSNVVAELQKSNALTPSSVVFASSGQSITWPYSPVSAGESLHYQMSVSGSQTPNDMCLQGAVPGQPLNTCVVVFTGASTCYMGYISISYDSNLTPIVPTTNDTGSTDRAAVVAPAVIVPLAVLAAVLLALYFFVYRRRRNQFNARADSDASLVAPLAASVGSVSDRAASGIHIRFPGSG